MKVRSLASCFRCRPAILLAVFMLAPRPAVVATADDVVAIVVDEKHPAFTVTGQILDAVGSPAANAVLTVKTYNRASRSRVARELLSNANGKFAFTLQANRERLSAITFTARNAEDSQIGSYVFPYGEKGTPSAIEIKLSETRELRVLVTDDKGHAVEGARTVVCLNRREEPFVATTDAVGVAVLRIPSAASLRTVAAWKDGHGLDYVTYELSRDERIAGTVETPETESLTEVKLKLAGAAPVKIQLVDDHGQPAADVGLSCWLLKQPEEREDLNLSYFYGEVEVRTDAHGVAQFPWFPMWHDSLTTFWASHPEFDRARVNYEPLTQKGQVKFTLSRLVPIRGRVSNADGSPASGVSVAADGAGYAMDGFSETTTTDIGGEYELLVAPNQLYVLAASREDQAAPTHDGFVVRPGTPVEGLDFKLQAATRIHGRLLDEDTQQPLPDQRVIVYQYGTSLLDLKDVSLPNPEESRTHVRPTLFHYATTDADGHFEMFLGPGTYDIRPPNQEKANDFQLSNELERELTVTQKVRKRSELTGMVVIASNGEPAANAKVTGVPRRFRDQRWGVTTNASGEFRALVGEGRHFIHATNANGTLAAIVEVKKDEKSAKVSLQAVGSAFGRLINPETKQPWADQPIEWGMTVSEENSGLSQHCFGGKITTDEDGRFQFPTLVNGIEFQMWMEPGSDGTYRMLGKVSVSPGEALDLGDVYAPGPHKPYVPPTLDERIAAAFASTKPPGDRLKAVIEQATLVEQHILVIFGEPTDKRARSIMAVRYEDEDYAKLRDEFVVLAISMDDARRAAAQEFATTIGEPFSVTDSAPRIVMLDREGNKLGSRDADVLFEDGELSKDVFLESLREVVPAPVDARERLAEVLAQARAENKRVFIQETATWCGPCHLLARFLRDNHSVWEKDYIWLRMDHRLIGARELMTEIRDGAEGGIPWFAVLDSDGNKLATSNEMTSHDNIGFPSSAVGIRHFESVLKSTRQNLSDDEIASLVGKLKAE